ncbi:MAG: hypothetical protein COY73_01825 [Candidatus Nealsonbacteria bacterium CG_4_10_14_0_8_um_filter_37_14]|uniref:Metallo-beta-lactamase domain-containing protein n=1 Tax=Candidatus Nealsonbacteria bacterium CG_4_10_14_0_8_um_filter_37_14 TaxID=1974684 RepID=A0A2M7R6C9_9BACT|nr:MAG: hypothetical protein COZ89_03045 [Candidatus Nealsonbacteria bacterium CG_4_8_14_3_um_filter_37_23]PIY89143.1 MAG: hypothetical protein COY73_01825 [Candidatus Nealsonbacteria bacterium CG_4_10_14_0_8_um_filter_37_14]
MMNKDSKKIILVIFGILIGLNILAWLAVYDLSKSQFLEVNFFDVGQGDSIFIETPQRHQILIDGGPDETILEKLGREMPFWDRTIDLIILTHPEHDHLAGLIEVLKRYKVENILWTGVSRTTSEYKEWQRALQKEQDKEEAKIYIAKSGQTIIYPGWLPGVLPGSHPGGKLFLDTLYPFENLEGQEVENNNNTSIVTRLVFDKISFLFTGDAYQSVERKLIKRGAEIDSDVLKVGHHGSKTSSAKEFIEAVSPETAVIQCGKNNSYGHPHPQTLENLAGIQIFRTDLDGDIKIISDGISYQVK